MYYLAYGSNLNIFRMKYRCRDASIVGTANLKDYRLIFKGSKTGSYLTVEKMKGYNVPLGVFDISESDLKSLDAYEGYPRFYYRDKIKVLLKDEKGEERYIEGIIYIMHEDRKIEKPQETYLNICKEGYSQFGFDQKILDEALEYSVLKASASE